MFKNTASKIEVFAFDTTNATAKTGDAANITAYYSLDNGSVTVLTDTSATERDSTNAKGFYQFDIAQSETNGDIIKIYAKSSTANIAVIGSPATIYTRPATGWLAPTTAGRTLDVASTGEAGLDFNNILSSSLVTLNSLTITGSTTLSDGLLISRSSSNTSAITATGNGTGSGIVATSGSGATGDGIQATAASTNGNGMAYLGTGTGHGLKATGGTSGNGVHASASQSSGTGVGMKVVGGSTSGNGLDISTTSGHALNAAGTGTTKHGINATGGTTTSAGIAATGGGTSGDGILISATSGHGINVAGGGTTKHGILSTGGATTSAGLALIGGATSGDGLKITTTSGHGMNIAATGASMHGITATGGTSGTSDGIKGAAGSGGVDIRGNITGNLVGTVSTLTTYTGNTPQTGDAYARLGAPAGASTAADIAAVKVDTAAVKVQTDKFAFTVANQVDANVLKIGGTTQTARDLGTSVLLSSGAGTGQLDFTSGVVKANFAQILGTALTETAGQLAGGFKKFFNIATPASTMDALTLVATATNLTNAPTAGDFTATMKTSITTAATAATPTAAAVTGDVGGNVVGSVGSVTGLTASNLDATISSRLASASYTTPPTANANADALLDRAAGIETGVTPRQGFRLMLSSDVGKISGAATPTISFRDTADSKDRIVATTDSAGNRVTVTLDAS